MFPICKKLHSGINFETECPKLQKDKKPKMSTISHTEMDLNNTIGILQDDVSMLKNRKLYEDARIATIKLENNKMIERKSDENNKKNTDQDKDIKVLENANQKLVSTTSILQNSFEDLERDLEKKESLDRNQEEKLLNLVNQSQNLFSTTTILQNTLEYLKKSVESENSNYVDVMNQLKNLKIESEVYRRQLQMGEKELKALRVAVANLEGMSFLFHFKHKYNNSILMIV